MIYDLIIIGAGPAGLSVGISAARRNLDYLILDKGPLVNSVYNFPTNMTFFSTPDLLSIGEMVFISASFRPSRNEALSYYRAVAEHYKLKIARYITVTNIEIENEIFRIDTVNLKNETNSLYAKKAVIATGYYDNPNMLNVEGENLDKVSHYFTDPHPYQNLDIAIVGGKNSAVEAALSLSRINANVTLIYRGADLSSSVKYWIVPDIRKKIETNSVKALFNSELLKIEKDSVLIKNKVSGKTESIKNDFVFAMTGYHPNYDIIKNLDVKIDKTRLAPLVNPDNLESSLKGLHFAGSIIAGINNNQIFIENSRAHGEMIFA